MPAISRRAALGALGRFAAASVATVAVAAPVATADPLKRLHALHAEASALMPAHNAAMGGHWELRIRADDDPMPVVYTNLDAVETQPLVDLLHEWRAAYHISLERMAEPALEAAIARCWELEDAAGKLPASTSEELAAKFLILSCYGEFPLEGDFLYSLVSDAAALIGVPAPARLAPRRGGQGA